MQTQENRMASPSLFSKHTENTKQDQWLPPPSNINQIFSYEKIQRLSTGNFNLNRPISSYISNKIETTIQEYQNKTINISKFNSSTDDGNKPEAPTQPESVQQYHETGASQFKDKSSV